ncbi:hypothetical protein GPALN_002049 [Globodera pallida]|nr:hypothetical protein GPALN_002049 [Globodera pallida]
MVVLLIRHESGQTRDGCVAEGFDRDFDMSLDRLGMVTDAQFIIARVKQSFLLMSDCVVVLRMMKMKWAFVTNESAGARLDKTLDVRSSTLKDELFKTEFRRIVFLLLLLLAGASSSTD